jgi:hypothetical protein
MCMSSANNSVEAVLVVCSVVDCPLPAVGVEECVETGHHTPVSGLVSCLGVPCILVLEIEK